MACAIQPTPSLETFSEQVATQTTMDDIEKAIDYRFNNKALLQLALTAAGANEDNPNGNRTLARVGQGVVQLVVAGVGFEIAASQGKQKLRTTSKVLFTSNPARRMDE